MVVGEESGIRERRWGNGGAMMGQTWSNHREIRGHTWGNHEVINCGAVKYGVMMIVTRQT